MAAPPRTSPVIAPNLGLYFDRPSIAIPLRGLKDCLNIRVKEGKISSSNMGWSKFASTNPLLGDGKPSLIDNFFFRNGGQTLIFGTTTDLYKFNEGAEDVSFITPRYEVGTATATLGSTAVVGVGTTWSTNLKAGDFITFGASGVVKPNLPNLLAYSEQFDNSWWNTFNGSMTANDTTAPDGTATAEKFTEDSTASVEHGFEQRVKQVEDNTVYRFVIYVKDNDRGFAKVAVSDKGANFHITNIDLSDGSFSSSGDFSTGTGAFGAATVTDAGNGWWKFEGWFNSDTGVSGAKPKLLAAQAGGLTLYNGDGTSSLFWWGADLRDASLTADYMQTERVWYEVDSVTNDTNLVLVNTWEGPTQTTQPYTARRVFTGGLSNPWSTEVFYDAQPDDKDLWFATNGVDTMVKWDGLTDQVTRLTGLTFSARELVSFKNMMIYVNIKENAGEDKVTSIKNSDVTKPEDVTNGLAGEFIVTDGVDPLETVFRLADNLVIYGQRTIVIAAFVGDPLVFIFRTAVAGIGPISGRMVADFGDFHEFIGFDTQYSFDGVTLQEAGSHVWREILRQRDPNRSALAFSHFDEENGDLLWVLPLTADDNTATEETPRTCWSEHYLEDVGTNDPTPHTKRQFPFTASGFFERQTTLTWDAITDTWESVDFAWNDQFFSAAFPFNLVTSEEGDVYTLNTSSTGAGTALTNFARFGRRALSAGGRGRNLIKRLYPYMEQFPAAGNLSINLHLSDFADGPTTEAGPFLYDLALPEGFHFVSPYRRARFAEVEFETTAAGQPWSTSGYDWDLVEGGER